LDLIEVRHLIEVQVYLIVQHDYDVNDALEEKKNLLKKMIN